MGKTIIRESGVRDIKELAKRYPKAKIYFHQDLDGVTTAIAMKKYLESNGIKVTDAEIIQYGDREFAVSKMDAEGDTMPVLVDFAHGKPMFTIHTDHHDKQIGVEKDTSKQFRAARSNVETVSQVVSPKELFPASDILLINTVDSADFVRQKLSADDVVNYLFRFNDEQLELLKQITSDWIQDEGQEGNFTLEQLKEFKIVELNANMSLEIKKINGLNEINEYVI